MQKVMNEPLHELQLLPLLQKVMVMKMDRYQLHRLYSMFHFRHQFTAEDEGEVTSEIHPSRQVQRDHPSENIIGDLHARVTTRSRCTSLAFFANSAFVTSFEPKDVGHALLDPN